MASWLACNHAYVHPTQAVMMYLQMRSAVQTVAGLFPTSIISGRGREKVEGFVQLKELFYAGSHGMDIVGPQVCCSCDNMHLLLHTTASQDQAVCWVATAVAASHG